MQNHPKDSAIVTFIYLVDVTAVNNRVQNQNLQGPPFGSLSLQIPQVRVYCGVSIEKIIFVLFFQFKFVPVKLERKI